MTDNQTTLNAAIARCHNLLPADLSYDDEDATFRSGDVRELVLAVLMMRGALQRIVAMPILTDKTATMQQRSEMKAIAQEALNV